MQEGKQCYVVYLFSYVYLNTSCLYNERIVVKLLVYIQFIKDTNTILIAYLLINITQLSLIFINKQVVYY